MRTSAWGYPIVLAAHTLGMGVLVGIQVMFCARVLGFARDFPLAAFDRLLPLSGLGFLVNLVSGAILFAGHPRQLAAATAFLLKLVLIVLAGAAFWVLRRGASPGTVKVRIAAALVIVLWCGVILAGRMIAYTVAPL